MTILLDTCAAIWLVSGAKVSQPAEAALNEARARDEPVYISPITGWEIGLLALKGRLASPIRPRSGSAGRLPSTAFLSTRCRPRS